MKVIVLGPVVKNTTSGGVAVFTEGLYKGFKNLGHESYLISNNASDNVENIFIEHNVFFTKKAGKFIKKIKPDLVICSLQYVLGIKHFKKVCSSAKYVSVMHGYSFKKYEGLKAFLINSSYRFGRKYSDFVVSVSHLTKMLNLELNNIRSDAVIENAANVKTRQKGFEKDIDFIYIGRLHASKNVLDIAKTFLRLVETKPDIVCAIGGYGELEEQIKKICEKNERLSFLGKLSLAESHYYMEKSKFFVSLNGFEPFGIVFAEAAICGCNVLTQSTSGICYNFSQKKYFHSCDYNSLADLYNNLVSTYNSYITITDDEIKLLRQQFCQELVCNKYLDLHRNN